MSELSKEEQRKALATKLKWGIGLLGALIIAPVVFLIVKGIIGLAIAGVLGLVAVNGAPVVAMKLANWKLGMLKSEANKNPIETLQLQEVQQEKDLEAFAEAITSFDSEVSTYEQVLITEGENANVNGILLGMKKLLDFRRAKYHQAKMSTVKFSEQVREAERKYRIALAAQRVTKAAGNTEVDVLNKILKDIAFTSVQNSVNTAMAELRTALMKEDIEVAINPAPVLENNPTQSFGNMFAGMKTITPEKVKVLQ